MPNNFGKSIIKCIGIMRTYGKKNNKPTFTCLFFSIVLCRINPISYSRKKVAIPNSKTSFCTELELKSTSKKMKYTK